MHKSQGSGRKLRAIYRRKAVIEMFGFAESTLYYLIKKGVFPRADVQLSPKCVGWSEEVLEAYREKACANGAAQREASVG